jgi:DNA-3-methyladenine glycosylase
MRRRRDVVEEKALCSGPGKLAQALGVTHALNGLPLTVPPFALFARHGKPEVVTGPRIGITKAVDFPWRYGLRGSKFVSKPFTA